MHSIFIVLTFLIPFCIGELLNCQNDFNNRTNCCIGYREVDNECIPVCKDGCPESQTCLQPDVCGCLDEGSDSISNRCFNCLDDKTMEYCLMCKPKITSTNTACEPNLLISTTDEYFQNSITDVTHNCQNDCKNGICIDGLCQNLTFSIEKNSISSTTDVTLNCQHDCPDGICIGGTCQKYEETSTISPLIIIDVTSNCQTGCWGGMCYEGICQCKEGLILNEETNDCIMPCENICQNGVCNQDRICECNQGYILQNQSGCVPQCDRECVNSICIAPTHCECLQGDISNFNISSALECLPTCEGADGEKTCQNGTCVAVNKCQCLQGFFPKPGDRFECVASLIDIDELQRKFVYPIGLIAVLTLLIIILFGCFAHKRTRRVCYNVNEIEKFQSTVVFQNHQQQECVF